MPLPEVLDERQTSLVYCLELRKKKNVPKYTINSTCLWGIVVFFVLFYLGWSRPFQMVFAVVFVNYIHRKFDFRRLRNNFQGAIMYYTLQSLSSCLLFFPSFDLLDFFPPHYHYYILFSTVYFFLFYHCVYSSFTHVCSSAGIFTCTQTRVIWYDISTNFWLLTIPRKLHLHSKNPFFCISPTHL